MSAVTEPDRQRLALEDVLPLLSAADEHLRCALLKLTQWARTNYEKEIIMEVLDARVAARQAVVRLSQYHPNHKSQGVTHEPTDQSVQ